MVVDMLDLQLPERQQQQQQQPRLIPPGIMPPQKDNPTLSCGGQWIRSPSDNQWHLVDDLSEMELYSVQVRLGGLERQPTPPPSPAPRTRQAKRKRETAPAPSSEPVHKKPREVQPCSVCKDSFAEVVFRNCGHACLCKECVLEMNSRAQCEGWIQCPICRLSGDTIDLFL